MDAWKEAWEEQAWKEAQERVLEVHRRTLKVLATLQKLQYVNLQHDGHDQARIICLLKAVVDECTLKQDFSEFEIVIAATKHCPISQ